MAVDNWTTMPFDQAVQVNPPVSLQRGAVYPFVEMKAVDPGSRSVRPSEMREFKGGGSRFTNGDTLMARITPCLENGKIARFTAPEGQSIGHGSTEFIVIRGRPNITDDGFAYYLTKWDDVRQYCISQMTGSSGRQRVPTNALSHRDVTIPSFKEQQAIACILGALDDKIELNRRINETLEAICQAVFKSWFVDFDPVRAKMKGRQPAGMNAETAALFPNALEGSELDETPKGWKYGCLEELSEITMGLSPPGSTYNEKGEGMPFFQGIRDFGSRFPARRVYCTSPKRFASRGDVLLSVRAPVGRLNIPNEECSFGRGLASLRSKSGHNSYQFYLMEANARQWAQFEADGTVFGSIRQKDITDLRIIIPNTDVIDVFDTFAQPIDDRIRWNESNSETLTATRNALLPMLISGKLSVADAERIVERCA